VLSLVKLAVLGIKEQQTKIITNMKPAAYFRVSTKQQGASGLGLEAQKAAVERYLKGQPYEPFIEVESGKKSDRIELNKALDYCKRNNQKLIVAKLDRLSRNLYFISQLQEAKIDFICCDMPTANRLTISIFAAIAEHEALTISARTKAALQAKRERGEPMGTPENLTHEGRQAAHEANRNRKRNNPNNRRAKALIDSLPESLTLAQIAERLNKSGFKTARGAQFNPIQVSRLKYSTNNS